MTLVGGLLVAACGGGGDDAASTTTTILVEEDPVVEAPTTTAAPETTTTTTTEAPLVVDGATVVVANASIVGGSAGRMTDELGRAGFTTAEATNSTEKVESSIVYYSDADGAQAVAESVAQALGGVEARPIPDPVPTESGDIAGAQVLVLLGNEQADRTIAELSGSTGSDEAADDGGEAAEIDNSGSTVVVANVSGVSGSAGRMSDQLAAAGFTVGDATNGVVQLADSVVHYTDADGAQADAEAIAAALGGVEVQPMPDEIPTESSEFDGDVLVLLGTNQADQSLGSLNP